ncbi:hypothetical protein PENANT_c036G08971 [Penicillium antarcticum]|uniref:MARVEL domain-containing protein n=1 Tax=Penicillium antarcticum TaxID=416450 RepID=A0A1V6PUD4_9EURO|nr:uncharacterized protein N7508_001998 [Penicillium antarcticum]KAJ5317490.1 hypothetical protein N7508_001998 [Penicillium antarcticum]OQD80327.1 hypothetical protein PENANT_c036G08971 [Penicillium antarcticum]
MSFILVKLLKIGVNEAKKRHKTKKEEQKFQAAAAAGSPQYLNNEQYPMSAYPAGAVPGTTMHFESPKEPMSKRAKMSFMFVSALRFLQFVFGLTVIGLYGKDVHHDHSEKHIWRSQWVYALVTGFLATVTAGIHLTMPFLMRRVKHASGPNAKWLLPQFAWEFVVTVLWLALFGVFGKMYIGVYAVESSSGSGKRDEAVTSTSTSSLGDADKITRMRHAVWIDVINLGFWVITSSWVLMRWLKSRRAAATEDAGDDAEKGEGDKF